MIIVNKGGVSKPRFPILARGKNSGALIAFVSETTGTVIDSGDTSLKQFGHVFNLKPLTHPDWRILESDEVVTIRNA